MFFVRHMPNRTKEFFDEAWKLLRTLGRDQAPTLTKQDHCRLVHSCQTRVNTVREIYRLYLEERRGLAAIANRFNRLKSSNYPKQRVVNQMWQQMDGYCY